VSSCGWRIEEGGGGVAARNGRCTSGGWQRVGGAAARAAALAVALIALRVYRVPVFAEMVRDVSLYLGKW
jgi:hypothetical protein